MTNNEPIILFGIPRSGTSWTARVLSTARNTQYIHEPDNEKIHFLSFLYKSLLPRFPYIRRTSSSADFKKLFDQALNQPFFTNDSLVNKIACFLSGISLMPSELALKHKSYASSAKIYFDTLNKLTHLFSSTFLNTDQRRIVKTVHACLSIPFLYENFAFTPVLIYRHPANVIASYLKMNMPDRDRNLMTQKDLVDDHLKPHVEKIKHLSTPIEKMALQISIFYFVMEKWEQEFNLISITHESLCKNTVESFKFLFNKLDLQWCQKSERMIEETNKPGERYQIKRRASEEIDKWKKLLNTKQIEEIKKGYHVLPVTKYKEF